MSLATLGIVANIASTGLQIAGSMAQAKATSQAANHNAKVAEMDAMASVRESQQRELFIRRRSQEELAKQKTNLAANNMDVSTGSPLTVLQNTLTLAEQDILAEREQGLIDANRYRDEAGMSRWEASRAKKSGKLAAGLGFLTGASNVITSGMSTGAVSSSSGLFTSRRPIYGGVNRNTWGAH